MPFLFRLRMKFQFGFYSYQENSFLNLNKTIAVLQFNYICFVAQFCLH